jgi:CubicO group peptidase (beta-lactamase class C family)
VTADRFAAAADAAFLPVAAALALGHIPGAVLGLADGSRREIRSGGDAALLPQPEPMHPDLLFDLASLTKVVLTTTEVLRLVESGRVDLDDALSQHLPDLHQYATEHPVRRITVRHCLAHRSGLPAVVPLYTWGSEPETLTALVLQKDWPLGEPVYSDIGFILLGLLVERLRDRPLRDCLPQGNFAVMPGSARSVATERCPWRGRILRGEVHDENAFALGGIAGHAGLFGTAGALLDFAARLLAGQVLRPATLSAMVEPQGGAHGLGWQIRHEGWSGGSLCSARTVGHTGFTGTALWIDLDRGLAWTLLTNRVHPTRHVETGIRNLRRSVSNVVAGAWDGARSS